MTKGERPQFVSIEEACTSGVRVNIQMPEFVDAQRIGVNLLGIHRLCRMGGINHLRVNSVSGEGSTNSVPQIVGFNHNGEAYAGKATVKTVPLFDSRTSNQSRPGLPHSARWVAADINLNMDEIIGRIQREERWTKGARSPEAWVYYFNQALKQGISKVGTNFLIFGLSKFDQGLSVFHNIDASLMSADASPFSVLLNNFHPHVPSTYDVILSLLVRNLAMNIVNSAMFHESRHSDGNRFSLIFGPQVDRALLLNIMAKIGTFVKEISPRKARRRD